ncbi:MAG TPA: translation initiation factor IF-2 [Candidatus Omnitrophota bacterium]|nr:translation initiation factor IF-2 [Candidatus Omnitrophota bacterium]
MRVHELAKKIGITSKALLEELKRHKIDAKSHMSVIDDEMAELVASELGKAQGATPAAKAPAQESPAEEPKSKTKTITAEEKPAPAAKPPVPEPPREATKEIKKEMPAADVRTPPPAPAPEPVRQRKACKVSLPISVGNLAQIFELRLAELIKALMEIGIFANVNQLLNEKVVFTIAGKLGIPVERQEEDEGLTRMVTDEAPRDLKLRPPVVTLMGHVDHGKTSLLDAIRMTNVVEKEAGRITQHIGAYGVDIPGKGHVTFLDTPGHAAFTAMRARGANVTDVVVLVVAADDGIMPQTVEAIDHARAAGVPIVVAINKVDLPAANPMRVKAELQKRDLTPEEWGGKTICVEVSAKTQKGIPELLEMLLLEAELLELKANPNRSAQGTVVESKLTKSRGHVTTLLVQNGTLKVGDALVCGSFYGRVRVMHNDRGKTVKEAGPSYAVEVQGLSGSPEAGEIFAVVEDDRVARKLAEKRALELREKAMQSAMDKHVTLEGLYSKLQEGSLKELKLILKADVQGSIEALGELLDKMSTEKIQLRMLHAGIGGINESDVMLAAASDAVIIGFHVKADVQAEVLAEKEGVEIRCYNIIYEACEDIKKAMEGLLEPVLKEVIVGRAEIRQVFKSSKVGSIGGAIVTQGRIFRSNPVRLIRDKIVVFSGRLASLRRFKDDVKEVAEGFECGVALDGYGDIREKDIVEAYKVEKIAARL